MVTAHQVIAKLKEFLLSEEIPFRDLGSSPNSFPSTEVTIMFSVRGKSLKMKVTQKRYKHYFEARVGIQIEELSQIGFKQVWDKPLTWLFEEGEIEERLSPLFTFLREEKVKSIVRTKNYYWIEKSCGNLWLSDVKCEQAEFIRIIGNGKGNMDEINVSLVGAEIYQEAIEDKQFCVLKNREEEYRFLRSAANS